MSQKTLLTKQLSQLIKHFSLTLPPYIIGNAATVSTVSDAVDAVFINVLNQLTICWANETWLIKLVIPTTAQKIPTAATNPNKNQKNLIK